MKTLGALVAALALSLATAAPALAANANAAQVSHAHNQAGLAAWYNNTLIPVRDFSFNTVYNATNGTYTETGHGWVNEHPARAVTFSPATDPLVGWSFDGVSGAPLATSWTVTITPSGRWNARAYYDPAQGSQ